MSLFGHYASGMLTLMTDIGHRTGLFDAFAQGPATSEELAARAGLQERYVREWLGALVTGRLVDYDPDTCLYTLPAEHAACLTGTGGANLAALAQINTHLGKHLHQVADAIRHGGGVPYAQFRPEFTDVMDAAGRGTYDEQLVDSWLPLADGLVEQLSAGARLADIGCGTGHAIVLLAKAFPASRFVGYDLAEDAIARARADAAAEGLSNLEDNLANPLAPWLYGVSTLHCLTVSLANGGAGLGTAWGHQRAQQALTDAGFEHVSTHDAPGDPLDTIFVATASHRPTTQR